MTNIPGFDEKEYAWIVECLRYMIEGKEDFPMPPPSKKALEYMIEILDREYQKWRNNHGKQIFG